MAFLATNPPIGKALSLDAFKGGLGALPIVQAGLNPLAVDLLAALAVVVAKVKLIAIAVKMRAADVVIGADQSALENGEIAFDCVRRDLQAALIANVFPVAMVHDVMRTEGIADDVVARRAIRHKARFSVNLLKQDRLQVLPGHVGNVEGTHVPVTLDKGKNLVHRVRPLLAALFAFLCPEVGFVGFYRFARSAERAGRRGFHRFADAMRHEPGRLVGHAQHALKLFAGHALLAGVHQVVRQNPLVQGKVGTLENGSYRDRVLLAAMPAEDQSGALSLTEKAALAIRAAAVRAYRAVRPADGFEVFAGGFVVLKAGFVEDRVGHGFFSVLWAK